MYIHIYTLLKYNVFEKKTSYILHQIYSFILLKGSFVLFCFKMTF